MSKRLIRIASITLFLLVLFYSGLYLLGSHSKPYKVARTYVVENDIVIERLGELESVRMAMSGFFESYHGTGGKAEFKLNVKGRKAQGAVHVRLRREVGKWDVVKANLELEGETIIALKE